MSGIVGIAGQGNCSSVKQMLDKIAYRGSSKKIIETASATVGVASSNDRSETFKTHQLSGTQNSPGYVERIVLDQGNKLILKEILWVWFHYIMVGLKMGCCVFLQKLKDY